ncbi:hypothetical protein [Renibacterium salmoninarum]|uniref:hypothetical protein n=1 Tax=Renibacterium salmoninarum TaxID=1646 RepID=UPI00030CC141|nr:hypothetical protein [Renibacterium salmoninarum]
MRRSFAGTNEALYAVEAWLAHRTPEQAEELIRRVKEGRLGFSAMPFNLHTEACSTDELHELLRPASQLRSKYGLKIEAAMQTDVPGHVVGFPDALGANGVKYLSVAHNWAGRSHPNGFGELKVPRIFRWLGPAGNSVLVWRTDSPHGGSYMEGNTVGLSENLMAASDVLPCYLSNLATKPFPLVAETVFGWLPEVAEAEKLRTRWMSYICDFRAAGRTTLRRTGGSVSWLRLGTTLGITRKSGCPPMKCSSKKFKNVTASRSKILPVTGMTGGATASVPRPRKWR